MNTLCLSSTEFPGIFLLHPRFQFFTKVTLHFWPGLYSAPRGAIIEAFSSFPALCWFSHPYALLLYRKWGRERRLWPALHAARDKPASPLQKSCFPLRTAFSLHITDSWNYWLLVSNWYFAKFMTLDLCLRCSFWWADVTVIECWNPTALFPWKDPISSLQLNWHKLYSLFIPKAQISEGKNDEIITRSYFLQRI